MTRRTGVPTILTDLWRDFDFVPNDAQKEAILHVDGPLFLPAGPGAGKTRVLLWRAVNLILTHSVQPDEIFLSTFTEKAALQLKNGLRTLLSAVSAKNGQSYDSAKLYVGTVHSLCRQLLADRRFAHHSRSKPPILLDELGQYMFLRRRAIWGAVRQAVSLQLSNDIINTTFGDRGNSRHNAITNLVSFFNRLSEEMIDPENTRTDDPNLQWLLECYEAYCNQLRDQRGLERTDLSLLQQAASKHLTRCDHAGSVFRHVIIDEYQDTNPIQERIFFQLASGHQNLCVVGDDDQALYRFRGATVENFVNFPERCRQHFGINPTKVVLAKNYRSREGIVDFYNRFIVHPTCDWRKKPHGAYRVMEKQVVPERKDAHNRAVVASSPGHPEDIAKEIATLVRKLLDEKKVGDPNQIAFLFPSLKSPHVERMRNALADVDIEVYAPRAGQFLNVPESRAIFGLLFKVFGNPAHVHAGFQSWVHDVLQDGEHLIAADPLLGRFIEAKRSELHQITTDYLILDEVKKNEHWSAETPYDPDTMPTRLAATSGLSSRAKKALRSRLFDRFARERIRDGRPFNVRYVITRATSVDWNVLDFFYQLAGFACFKAMFDMAENGTDEAPVCNLSLISSYLGRFLDHYPFPVTGESIDSGQSLQNLTSFLYILYRRGESEYEDADDPFPKGRVPFITIHQAKGLEFPVVVLANPRKDPKLQRIEQMVAPLLTRQGEPLDRMPLFDVMRMFYVALSRAQNLLVLAHYSGPGQRLFAPFSAMLNGEFPRISQLDIATVPAARTDEQTFPECYSYTGDFLLYQKCPRQYMLLRKYGFVPSRSQTMFFGSLVHQTLDDLHQLLIDARRSKT